MSTGNYLHFRKFLFLLAFLIICRSYNLEGAEHITSIKTKGISEKKDLIKNTYAAFPVKGKVTDKNDNPLIGVTITIAGNTSGTITDENGNFSLEVPDVNSVLLFSYLGFITKKVQVNQRSIINVFLEEEVNKLDEVVVVGYGTVRKRDLTGSVSSINAEELKDAASVSFGDAMRGKLSGVQVTSSSGEPGAGLDIKIRGTNSIGASSSPLYVIDGVPVESDENEVKTGGDVLNGASVNPLSYIDPNNIQSIEVLKDASATAIYGSRGANGVIIITTKTAEKGKPTIAYNTKFGVSQFNKRIPLQNAPEYAEYMRSRFPNDPAFTDIVTGEPIIFDVSETIDWQDLLYQDAFTQNHNLSFGSNTDKSKIYMSAGYNTTDGIIIGSNFNRLSLLFNADIKLSEKLNIKLRSTNALTNRRGQFYGQGQGGSAGITNRILTAPPISQDLFDPENENTYNSPLDFATLTDKLNKSLNTLNNITLSYKITNDLTLNVSGGGSITNSKNTSFIPAEISNAKNKNGIAVLGNALTFNVLNENTLNYIKKIGDHSITGLLGFTQQRRTIESFNLQAVNFPLETNRADAIQDAVSINNYGSNKEQFSLLSYLSRVNYTYKGKYLATATLRADGSSKFAKGNRYSFFPALALAWQAGEENFVKKLNVFDQLKLRLSAGQIGNQGVPAYSSLARINTVRYYTGDTEIKGAQNQSIANPDLTWESSITYNAALDMSFLHERISSTIEVYHKYTKDLLLLAPIAGSSGFVTAYKNLGELQNNGLEFSLSTINIKSTNFTWTTDLNFNINKNLIKDIGPQEEILVGKLPPTNNNPNILKVGYPIGSYYGYIQDGLYQNDDFEDDLITLKPDVAKFDSPRPGYLKYKDISGPNGIPDGVIDAYDRTVIGDRNPNTFGGIRNLFTYKKISLSTFFSWQEGNEIINWGNRLLYGGEQNNNNRSDIYNNRWTPENTNTNIPGLNSSNRAILSTYYIKDASFLRLQNVTLTYNLASKFLKRLNIASASINLSADNLYIWTNYDGYDPEITSTDPEENGTGVDNFSYPRPKTYTLGLNINF